jgi:ribonucleoside-triphosphate reductase
MAGSADLKPTDSDFLLERLFPKYVITSKGDLRRFNGENIAKSLVKETGLPENVAQEVGKAIIRKIAGLGLSEITTTYIRELTSVELTARGMHDARNKFIRLVNTEITKFRLDDAFVDQYRGKQPHWGPIGYFTFKRTYARPIEGEERTEEYWETVRRVVEGCFSAQKFHCTRLSLPFDEEKGQQSAQTMFKKMWDFKFIAPGRGLWMMGTEFVDQRGSMALNNCGFVSTEDIDLKGSKAFEWTMDGLMLGVGIGFDTKGANKLVVKDPNREKVILTIPDSREGWVDSLGHVLRAYFFGINLPELDYSIIRPAGAPIKGFGGVASGPGPLKEMHDDIRKLLDTRIGQPLRSTDIVDIFNFIGKCVVAGNVRRSAEIALGSMNDDEYIKMKEDQEKVKSHRWASNNSVLAEIGMDYSKIANGIAKNGEPGVLYLENARKYGRTADAPDWKDKKAMGVNPCGEQTLESFELCCLVETFPSRHDSWEEFKETLKYAYLYAKSVTLLNTHWKETNAVMGKNRRIGISQSGIIDAFVKHGRRTMLDWCDKGFKYLRELDDKTSDWLCIPKSIKITTVKPSGTVSLLPGVSPGIHYPHAEYYLRRVRIGKNSRLVPALQAAGYHLEDDTYSKASLVVDFPIHESHFDRAKHQVSIWEQVENAADYQRYWSDNQVSITVTFRADETKDIVHVLEAYEDKIKGLSMLPLRDHGYVQAPYEEITKERYEELVKSLRPLELEKTLERSIGSMFCDGENCLLDI